MEDRDAVQAYVNQRLAYGIQLVRAEPGKMPVGIASGFIVPVEERFRIVSAGHAIGASPNWAIETLPVSATETLMLTVSGVRTLVSILPKCQSGSLDIAWADLQPDQLKAQLSKAPKLPTPPIELPLYHGPLDLIPDPEVPYGFAAWNRVELHPHVNKLLRESSYEVCMKYAGADPDNGLYRFELARAHQGREYYEGASGAAITDPEGRIVSMLVCGDEEEQILYGVPLAVHAKALLTK